MEILTLPGKSALSKFGLARMQAHVPAISYAEHVHLLELIHPLNDRDLTKVEALLDYGPNESLPEARGVPFATAVPRLGTISPWSSKASDIFAICDLGNVARVERGVRWFVEEGAELGREERAHLFDRMTESLLFGDDFAGVFQHRDPAPVGYVAVHEQ